MVKPPRSMQPEGIDADDALHGTKKSNDHQRDDFRHYMATKIAKQREQFGLQLPPTPPKEPKKRVRFVADDCSDKDFKRKLRKRKRKGFAAAVLKKLQKREEPDLPSRIDYTKSSACSSTDATERIPCSSSGVDSQSKLPVNETLIMNEKNKSVRKDLFMSGVVVLINGYTNPDSETLQRLLQKHGGDVERYETVRVTHIIAERLSAAKANMYRNKRYVCRPAWITDSVNAKARLSHVPYLLSCVRPDIGTPPLTRFFGSSLDGTVAVGGTGQCLQQSMKVVPSQSRLRTKTSDATVPVEFHQNNGSNNSSDHVSAETGSLLLVEAMPRKVPPTQSAPISSTTEEQNLNCESPNTDFSHQGSLRRPEKKNSARTVGTDPNFLDSFFSSSRLSFIGSFQQRSGHSPDRPQRRKAEHDCVRYVLHVDMDAFFSSVVLRKFPQYRDCPVAISHNSDIKSSGAVGSASSSTSECATCNYHARKFGIKKGMYLGRARQLCPHLVVLDYDFEGYQEVSDTVTAILQDTVSLHDGALEKVSCDESFLELHLSKSGDHRSIVSRLAEDIRVAVFDATQCTATVGVARNKFLAKLATDKVKPNKTFIVDDFRLLLQDLQLKNLHGIGYRSKRKLEDQGLTAVQDVWNLGSSGQGELIEILGPALGQKIFDFCNGVDSRPVEPTKRKTIGAECNYGVRFNGEYGVDYMVKGLAREVEKRMKNIGVAGNKVTLKVKQRKANAPPPPKFLGHGSCHNLSKSSCTPGKVATQSHKTLYKVTMELLHKLNISKNDIRGMGIVVSGLSSDSAANKRTVMDMLQPPPDVQKEPAWSSAPSCATSQQNATSPFRDDASVARQNTVECSQFYDVALPSLSQIHMSQVEALPEGLQRRIRKRLAHHEREQHALVERGLREMNTARENQIDLVRMLKLAADKTRYQQVSNGSKDDPIVLSQLERLPLENQLQIANDDQVPLRSGRTSFATHKRSGCEESSDNHRNSATPIDQFEQQSDENDADQNSSRSTVYLDDIRPLSQFLGNNPEPASEVVSCVVGFFKACVKNGRLHVIVPLLRSVGNRGDAWSSYPFDIINKEVDSITEELYDCVIDREWRS